MQRILIIRFSSIGDIVLCSPVVRALRKRFPDADIRFLTKRAYAELLEPNPYLNGVFLLDDDLKAVIAQVRTFRPDIIIDLHHNLRTAIVKAAVSGKSYAFPKLNVEKWLHVNLKLDTLPDIHIVNRYMKTVEPLGAVNDGMGLNLFFPENIPMTSLPDGFADGYVAVVVGAKFFTKQIPEQKLAELLRSIRFPVVLIGGPEDAEKASRLATSPSIYNACGKFPLLQSARLVQHAKLVITPDTGMMHIAAAFNRPIISIWGNTVPQFGMSPYMPQHPERSFIIEQKGLPCRPCSKIGHDACPKGHFRCMLQLDVEHLVTLSNQIMIV